MFKYLVGGFRQSQREEKLNYAFGRKRRYRQNGSDDFVQALGSPVTWLTPPQNCIWWKLVLLSKLNITKPCQTISGLPLNIYARLIGKVKSSDLRQIDQETGLN